jgi:hypothetical protein
MANTKISALTSSTTPLAGTEVLPIVQSSTTKQVSVANLTAGRSVSAADYVMSTGNLVPSTAAKGVNYTANTPVSGMTSQLLNWYEEGNCSITLTAGAGSITSSSVTAKYTRTGRLVTITGYLSITNNGTGSSFLNLVGLPFTPGTAAAGVGREGVNTGLGVVIYISAGTTTCQMFTTTNTYPVLTGSTVNFSMSYIV